MTVRVRVHGQPTRSYVKVPNAFTRARLKPGVSRLLIFLAGQHESFTVYNERSAEQLGTTRKTFARWIELAEQTEYLVRCGKSRGGDGHGNPLYLIHVNLQGFTEEQRAAILAGGESNLPMEGSQEYPAGHGSNVPTIEAQASGEDSRVEDHPLSPSAEPRELSSNWQPNYTHWQTAYSLGLDQQLTDLANSFLLWAIDGGERRASWDRAFGKFLNDTWMGRAHVTFPGVSDYENI